jgi:hypothetical protein
MRNVLRWGALLLLPVVTFLLLPHLAEVHGLAATLAPSAIGAIAFMGVLQQPWVVPAGQILAGPQHGPDAGYAGFRLMVPGDIPFFNPSGGADFYVDNNSTNVVNDGASWDTAFLTLTPAFAAASAYIASGHRAARRCRIFVAGDAIVEDLITLPQKTDVIGVGQCDGFGPGARIQGNHVIGAALYPGCRFYNLAFLDDNAGGTIFTVPSTTSALEFHGCDFLSGANTVVAVKLTGVTDLVVDACRFFGSWVSSFSTAALSLLGACHRAMVQDNLFQNSHATGVGVLIDAGFTSNGPAVLRRNQFNTTAMALNDAAAAVSCVDNRFIVGTVVAINTSIVYAAAKSAGNIVTGSNGSIHAPVTTD